MVGKLHGLSGISCGNGGLAFFGDGLGILRGYSLDLEIEREDVNLLTWASYHWRKGVASTWMIAFLTRVFVRTSSLFDAL